MRLPFWLHLLAPITNTLFSLITLMSCKLGAFALMDVKVQHVNPAPT